MPDCLVSVRGTIQVADRPGHDLGANWMTIRSDGVKNSQSSPLTSIHRACHCELNQVASERFTGTCCDASVATPAAYYSWLGLTQPQPVPESLNREPQFLANIEHSMSPEVPAVGELHDLCRSSKNGSGVSVLLVSETEAKCSKHS